MNIAINKLQDDKQKIKVKGTLLTMLRLFFFFGDLYPSDEGLVLTHCGLATLEHGSGFTLHNSVDSVTAGMDCLTAHLQITIPET